MGTVHFVEESDAEEITKALQAEGYRVSGRPAADPAARGRWVLEVEPYDDGVVAMVDVYGGWLEDEL